MWILRWVSIRGEVAGVLELSVVQAATVFIFKREKIKERKFKGRRGGFRVSALFGRHPGICGVY